MSEKQDAIEEISINGVQYVRKGSEKTVSEGCKDAEGRRLVIIRATGAGVHFGYLAAQSDKTVRLTQARRLWSWTGARTLNEVANHGVGPGSRISEATCSVEIADWHEIIDVTQEAAKVLAGVVPWSM